MSAYSERTVVARKRHWCEEYASHHRIEPGDTYVRAVAFPDGDINTGTTPWVMRLCAQHYIADGLRTLPPRGRRTAPTTRTPEESPDE